MKQNKKIIIFILTVIYAVLLVLPAFAAGNWKRNEQGRLQYEENGTNLEKRWLDINGERYYFNDSGICMENEWFSIETPAKEPKDKVRSVWYYAGKDGAIYKNGWHKVDGKEYYFNNSGVCSLDSVVTVDGKKYYISREGGKQGPGWFSIEKLDGKGNPYLTWYCAKEGGELYCDGWQLLNGKYYYFNGDGSSLRKTFRNMGEKRYYFDEQGCLMQDGWFTITGINGNGKEYTNWYYAEQDGDLRRNGFSELEGKKRYFDGSGMNYRERWYVDPEKNRYYLDKDGVLQTGFFQITSINQATGAKMEQYYYADETGSVKKNGLFEVDGENYYFDGNGQMYRNRWLTDKQKRRRYFLEDGTMAQDEWFGISGTRNTGEVYTNWYYADKKGYILEKGIYEIDGKRYMIDANGVMRTGWYQNKMKERYYYDENGAQAVGWNWLPLSSDWYGTESVARYLKDFGNYAYFYFEPETGKLVRNLSTSTDYIEVTIDGKQYAVDRYGLINAGWAKVRDTKPQINGYHYYLPQATGEQYQGERARNYWVRTVGPADMDGSLEETWYRMDENGEVVHADKNKYLLKEIEGYFHVFDEFGRTYEGFVEIEDNIYYFDPENQNRAVTGMQKLNDGNGEEEYCFQADGKAVTGVMDGKLYYKGRLQRAAEGTGCQTFTVKQGITKVVDEQGLVVDDTAVEEANKSSAVPVGPVAVALVSDEED